MSRSPAAWGGAEGLVSIWLMAWWAEWVVAVRGGRLAGNGRASSRTMANPAPAGEYFLSSLGWASHLEFLDADVVTFAVDGEDEVLAADDVGSGKRRDGH